jgi:hypothetical protein
MRHSGAAGRCRGKTGTLTGVSNLVGYCQSAGGHLLAFAIFTDGIEIAAAHTFQDHMAITLANSNIGANGEAARASALFAPLVVTRARVARSPATVRRLNWRQLRKPLRSISAAERSRIEPRSG